MGELIKFSDLKNKGSEKSAPSEKREGNDDHLNMYKLTDVLNILTALKKADISAFGQRTIDRKRKLVSGYTDNELFGWINNYTEATIKVHPSFFGAIIDELRFRKFI